MKQPTGVVLTLCVTTQVSPDDYNVHRISKSFDVIDPVTDWIAWCDSHGQSLSAATISFEY